MQGIEDLFHRLGIANVLRLVPKDFEKSALIMYIGTWLHRAPLYVVLAEHVLGYLCKVKMRRCREYDNINSGERDRASKWRHRKQKRMSIESADMERLSMTGWSKPTEASGRIIGRQV